MSRPMYLPDMTPHVTTRNAVELLKNDATNPMENKTLPTTPHLLGPNCWTILPTKKPAEKTIMTISCDFCNNSGLQLYTGI